MSAGPQQRPAPFATITHAGRQWPLSPGAELTFGRGSTCDIRLPSDPHLSRLAGSLVVCADYLLVHNRSTTKPFVLRPPAGEDRVVEPGSATTSLPFGQFQLVMAGSGTSAVALAVLVVGEAAGGGGPTTALPGAVTVTTPFPISDGQRRVLQALCAPLLTRRGEEAVPATYHQVGAALGLSPQYVRNVVQGLREALAGHGVPGLVSDDPSRTHADFRWALARHAIRSGWVDEARS